MVEEPLPGRQGTDGDRRGLHVCQAAWLGSQGEEGRNAILRHCAIGIPVVHAEDFLPDLETADILADARDDPGKFMGR